MAKYKCKFSFEPITDTGTVKVTGCNNFSFYNAGNVNATINRLLILQPKESWPNLQNDISIEIEQEFSVEFNVGADIPPPTFEAPKAGFNASVGSDTNPLGIFDTRVILIKTHLSEA